MTKEIMRRRHSIITFALGEAGPSKWKGERTGGGGGATSI